MRCSPSALPCPGTPPPPAPHFGSTVKPGDEPDAGHMPHPEGPA